MTDTTDTTLARYIVKDQNNQVLNIIMWDGDVEQWQPPEGCTASLVTDLSVSPGDIVDDQGKIITRAPQPTVE